MIKLPPLLSSLLIATCAAELHADPGDLLVTFTNPNGGGNDQFGFAVAALGSNVLVGAPETDVGGTLFPLMENGGLAYLFDGSTGDLLQTFADPYPAPNARFGHSIAAVGENVLIGAPGADAAYLFDPSGTMLRRFRDTSPTTTRFGFSVAALGEHALIGAPYGELAEGGEKVVWLDGSNGSVLQLFRNPNPDMPGTDSDLFGHSLAPLGDQVIVGAPHDETTAAFAGAAYLFGLAEADEFRRGVLLRTFENPSPDRSQFDNFGVAVAAFGDNVLVGDPPSPVGGPTSLGTVHLFDRTSGTVLRSFDNPTAQFADGFGRAIATAGNNVIVGAPGDTAPSIAVAAAGAVYLFDGRDGIVRHTFLSPEPAFAGAFGSAVASVGDDVLVGAPSEGPGDGITDRPGIAYLFAGFPDPGIDSDELGTGPMVPYLTLLLAAALVVTGMVMLLLVRRGRSGAA